jgi:hypothetical protein
LTDIWLGHGILIPSKLEAVVWAAFSKSVCDDLWIGFEDDGEIGLADSCVEFPQKTQVNVVQFLGTPDYSAPEQVQGHTVRARRSVCAGPAWSISCSPG